MINTIRKEGKEVVVVQEDSLFEMGDSIHKKVHEDWGYGDNDQLDPQMFMTPHEGGNDELPLSYQFDRFQPLNDKRPKVLYGQVEIRGFTGYEEIYEFLGEIRMELVKSHRQYIDRIQKEMDDELEEYFVNPEEE